MARSATPLCRAPPPPPGNSGSERKRLGVYLRQLPSQKSDHASIGEEDADAPDEWLGCARCLRLLDEIRAEGLPVPADAQNAVMRACSSRVDVVQSLFQGLVDAGIETEASFAAMMQAQLASDDLDGALRTLDALLSKPRLRTKLRTCSPLLTRLCQSGDSQTAVGLWERLALRGVEFTQREYAARLQLHGRMGEAAALERTLTDLLMIAPTPDADTVAAIEAAVGECSVVAGPATPALAEAPEGGASISAAAAAAALVVRRGEHDSDGSCGCCGGQLRVIGLTAAERERVRDTILARAASRSASGLEHLQRYREWLRVRPPFDYVLDGPNIAYFKQNYQQGRFTYAQIQLALEALRASDPTARILVLLPTKYLRNTIPNHTSSSKRTDTLTEADRALLNAWQAEGILYDCSGNLYDDWYWMYATVAETQAPEPPHPEAKVTRVVTNDAMRDHWHDLLPVIPFNRWRHAQVAAFQLLPAPPSGPPDERADISDAESTISDAEITVSDAEITGEQAEAAVAGKAPPEAVPLDALQDGAAPEGTAEGADGRAVGLAEASAVTQQAEEAATSSQEEATRSIMSVARVAPPPLLSVEAQRDGHAWHVPVPNTSPQEWLCFSLPGEECE